MKNTRFLLFPSTIAASFILLAPSAFADAIIWDGGGADKNWATVANWSDDASPAGDDVTFNATGALATGSTNIVSASESITSLSYNFEDATNQQTTNIAAGQTLNVAGNFSVLSGTAPAAPTNVSITGSTGILGVVGASFLLGNPTQTSTATTSSLDMSGLGTFTANLSSVFRIGGGGNGGNTTGNVFTLRMPVNSTITAPTVGISDFSNFNTSQRMLLGSGVTTINTNSLRVGNSNGGRSSGELSFNAAPGSLKLRGPLGGDTPVTTLNMVNAVSNTGNNISSVVNLAGHSVDAKITTLNMSLRTGTGTGGAVSQSMLTFDQGTLDVGTANMARNGNAALDGTIAATINIGGGTASFGFLNMADNTSGNTSKTTTATLNLNGGNTTVTGGITKLGTTNAVASVVVNGGTLDMSALNIGTLTNPVTLSLRSGVLKNVGEVSGGDIVAGLISKTTAGSVILSGTINYSGGSSVTGGALVFRDTTAKPATGTHAFSADTTLGLGVATSGAPFFTSGDVNNAFSGTMTGNLSNVTVTPTTNVGIDTTAGNFTYAVLGSPTKGLSKFGINTLTLTGSNNYTGPTIIDEGTLTFATTPSLTGSLTFGTNAANATAGTLDLTTANATFSGVMLVNTNSATANEIKVGPTQTLTINNNVQIGATTPSVTGTVTKLNLTGGGSFNVITPAAGTFLIGATASATNSQFATLDLTALKATSINASTTGTLRVSIPSATNIGGRAELLLPTPVVADTLATTTLTAGTIGVGTNATTFDFNTHTSAITLGTGLTKLNVDTINVGTGSRDSGKLIYDLAQTKGDLIIRAADGSSRAAAINVSTTTGSTAALGGNLVDFSGHDADILVTSLNVGNHARTGNLTSVFNFGAGDASLASKLDATNVNIGFRTPAATTTTTLTDRVNISGGTVTFGNVGATSTGVDIGSSTYILAGAASTRGELNISNGTVTIHNSTSLGAAVRLGTNDATGGGTVTASINLSGGTTTLGGDIIRNTVSPRTTSIVKISGGTLNMSGNDIGTSSTELITLTAESGTLQNVASINVNGGLTKTTAGSLVISGTNTYTGDTTVSSGTLALGANNALPATPVSIGSATLDAMTFDDNLGTLDTAGSAVINLGAGANLVFADSSGIDWTGGTLNITGTFVSGSSLRFGTTNASLTVTQLGLISATGFTGFGLDSNGFLTASAGGSNYASWASANGIPGQPPAGDFDNDGITNIVEYALGKSPTVSSQPAGVLAGNVITYTKGTDAIANGDVSWVIETSQTLALGSWTPQVTQPAGNPAATISYTLTPSTPVKNFARLKVTQP